jgi:hypothetical protein
VVLRPSSVRWMPSVIKERLRVLAIGIRPTLASECGLKATGSVDLLDASGIIGWRLGLNELVTAMKAAERPSHDHLCAWARAELDADEERWRYLEAFVSVLIRATANPVPTPMEDSDEGQNFWPEWERNMRHALDLLSSSRLVVSPAAIAGLREAKAAFPAATGEGRELVNLLARLEHEAAARVEADAGGPSPLVLPEYRDVLTAALRPQR